MINLLTNIITTRPRQACVCVCFAPRCQTDWSFMEGYTAGYADLGLECNPQ